MMKSCLFQRPREEPAAAVPSALSLEAKDVVLESVSVRLALQETSATVVVSHNAHRD